MIKGIWSSSRFFAFTLVRRNIISGVSAGALAGVFYADGNEPHKVLDYFSGHKFQEAATRSAMEPR